MDLLDQIHRTTFLGSEFLTWLWHCSDVNEGRFDLGEALSDALGGGGGDFELWFEDKLVVGSAMVDAQENHFKGGQPTTSLEAHTALRLGKLAREAKVRIVRGTQEWAFTLKGDTLATAGVKVPAVLAKEESEAFIERMALLEQLDLMVKGLFGQFLHLRLSDTWQAEALPALHDWVRGSKEG